MGILLRNRGFEIHVDTNRYLRTQCTALLPRGYTDYESRRSERVPSAKTSLCSVDEESGRNNQVHKDTRSIEEVDPVILKYTNILNELRSFETNTDNVHPTNFGSIRFDSENVVKVHGQYDSIYGPDMQEKLAMLETKTDEGEYVTDQAENDLYRANEPFVSQLTSPMSQESFVSLKENTADIKKESEVLTSTSEGLEEYSNDSNYVDSLYFGSAHINCSKTSIVQSAELNYIKPANNKTVTTGNLNYVDECVFGDFVSRGDAAVHTQEPLTKSDIKEKHYQMTEREHLSKDDDLSYIDKVFFNDSLDTYSENQTSTVELSEVKSNVENHLFNKRAHTRETDQEFCSSSGETMGLGKNITPTILPHLTENPKENEILVEYPVNPRDKAKPKVKNAETAPKSAFEYVVNMRKDLHEKKHGTEMDGNMKKSYKKVLSLLSVKSQEKFTKYEILKLLKTSVIYDQDDIVGLYKPYGMTMHSGTSNQQHILADYLPDLAKHLETDELYPVHRLDAGTTGVLLMARTPAMADTLKRMLKKHQIKKTYWAITKGVPNPLRGVIDIPISEGMIEGRHRMVLSPVENGIKSSKSNSHLAVTTFKVLARINSASLVELSPMTGVKHQLRVHLGFGLSCPVLGDHKYSHFQKMTPQRLPGDVLDLLKMKQSKVRDLPMFLHSRSVLIPEIADGRNVFIYAKLPAFFNKALSLLKLNRHHCQVKFDN